MEYVLFNPNAVPLLQGIRPFMPGDGKKVINGALSIIDLLSSTHGQTALNTLSDLFISAGSKGKWGRSNQAIDDSIATGLGIAFALFLILILLILCCVFLFWDPAPDSPGDEKNNPAA